MAAGISQGTELPNLRVFNADPTIAPGIPGIPNQLLIRTDNNTLYYYAGPLDTNWIPLGGAVPPPATIDITGLPGGPGPIAANTVDFSGVPGSVLVNPGPPGVALVGVDLNYREDDINGPGTDNTGVFSDFLTLSLPFVDPAVFPVAAYRVGWRCWGFSDIGQIEVQIADDGGLPIDGPFVSDALAGNPAFFGGFVSYQLGAIFPQLVRLQFRAPGAIGTASIQFGKLECELIRGGL